MTAPTKLSNLLNPQVVAEYIDAKLVDKIKLSPLAVVGTELQGRPGNTLTVPVWQYVGEASDLAEGVADIPVVLNSDSETVTVKKAAKSIEITDEAVLSSAGNPVGEIADQLLLSIADKVEKDCYTALEGATLKHTATVSASAIADAIGLFGEDLDEEIGKRYPEETPEMRKIKELEQKLAEKEREAVRKELTIKAQQLASEKGLPADLAAYFIAENEELTIENIEKFDSAYKSHLDNAVIERTKGTTPKMTASQSPKQKDVKHMSFSEFAAYHQNKI